MAAALDLLTQIVGMLDGIAVFDIFISRWNCPGEAKKSLPGAVKDAGMSTTKHPVTCYEQYN